MRWFAGLLVCLAACTTPVPPLPLIPTATVPPTATAVPTATIAGGYSLSGTTLDGAPYSGSLTIAATGDAQSLTWTIGSQTYRGPGLRDNGVLVAAWGDSACGVVLYAVSDGGLRGRWLTGAGDRGTENATRQSGSGLLGTYSIAGGSVSLAQRGQVVQVAWTPPRDGIGLPLGGWFGATWGSSRCSVAVYAIEPDGTLVGSWGSFGRNVTGGETARPVSR